MNNPLVYLFRMVWHYAAGNRRRIVLYWFLFIIAIGTEMSLLPFVYAKMMNIIQAEGVTPSSMQTLLGLLGVIVLTELFFWANHGPARVLERENAFKARINYRRYLLKGIMTLPLEWHVEHHSGDTIDKVEKGTAGLFHFAEDSFQVIYSLVQLLICYIMLAYFSGAAAAVALAMLILTIWIITRFDRVLVGQYQELNRMENNITESIFDAISNISTVVILRVERLVFKAIMHKVEKPFALFQKNSVLNEWKWFLTNLDGVVMVVLVLGTYFWQHIGAPQGVMVGSVYLLIKYLEKINDVFFRFADMYASILQQRSRVLNGQQLTKDFKPENFTNHVLPSDWRRLEINGLSFSYPDNGGADNLRDISLSLARGERIAFIGESGSGKTTLLKIIRDLYHPQALALSVDGQVIPDGFAGISRAIALVPQDPEIFATTIWDNITLGAEYEMAFVQQFTDMACFTAVAQTLPRQFDSSIKERGVNLSGGQQQRLALARGLLACHDKDIVLLDEPTSSLDMATEMQVYRNIFGQFKDKTIISCVHRLHLLPLFRRVYLFDQGRIVASGSVSELLMQSAKFENLWQQHHAH